MRALLLALAIAACAPGEEPKIASDNLWCNLDGFDAKDRSARASRSRAATVAAIATACPTRSSAPSRARWRREVRDLR